MASTPAPGAGLHFGWNPGESGIADELDENWLAVSVHLQPSVVSATTPLPATPAKPTDVHIVPSGAAANANAVAVFVKGAWVYFAPKVNWAFRVADQGGAELVFNGTSWVAAGGGGGESGGVPEAPLDGQTYGRKDGGWTPVEDGGGGSPAAAMPSAGLTAIQQSPADTTADFDFLSLAIPAQELEVGLTLEAQFTGTQNQAAAAQNLIFYAKVNDGAAIVLGQVGTGSSVQNYRAISGSAMLTLLAAGASGSYTLGGYLQVNGLVPYSSNSASPRAVNTATELKLTLGIRCSVANVANFNHITNATIKRVV